jgi:predicted RecB family nuclease
MYKRSGELVFSPSDLITFFESPFASWMDRFHVESPGALTPDGAEASLELVAAMGVAHEARVVQQMRDAGRDVWEPPEDVDPFEATLEAMRAGREVIFQAALRRGSFAGHADFLLRVDRPSPLGAFSYEVADTKLARKPKPYFLIQLCAYAEMVGAVQGTLPERVHVIAGDGAEHAFRTDGYVHYFRALERAFLQAQRDFDPEARPVPDARADHRRWSSHAAALLEKLDHPSRVAGITATQIKRLAAAGVTTMTALARTRLARVPRVEARVFDRLRRQARLQLDSAGEPTPRYELAQPDPEDPRRGLAMLPPPSEGDVFFDMEGYPFAEGGLEYLFGATYLEGARGKRGKRGEKDDAPKRRFFEQWAHDPKGEKKAFEAFVDWAYARFEADPCMHIYHYAPYEVTALRRLMGRYGTREREVDALLRAEVFVDLYRVFRQGVLLGEPRYSLKNVEHLYRPARAGEVSTAGESVTEYARWLEAKDGPDAATSKILGAIRDYNIEDCDSTLELRDWLLARQEEAGVVFIPAPSRGGGDDGGGEGDAGDGEAGAPTSLRAPDDAELVAERLRAAIPEDPSGEPERWRIQSLLADLVGFHRRELKPVFWAMFDRRDATHDQLADDPDCLGGLTRTKTARAADKRSFVYEYAFDPDQETKLAAGSKCLVAETLDKIELHDLDLDRGRAWLRLGPNKPAPPRQLSLIPNDKVPSRPIDGAVLEIARAWELTGALAPALDTLLRRKSPRVKGRRPGAPVLPPGDEVSAAVTRAILALDQSTLAIQGPPGSGKTSTGARAIAELLARGFRVGVTSNSHKAIENLMGQAVLASADPDAIHAVKIKSTDDEDIVARGLARHASSIRTIGLDTPDAPDLVGGTAWAFCHDAAIGNFDYLFVDEASQVSLANVVGMSRATRNIVLLGDPMQLPQPLQGSHPGESGQSALGYLLGERPTIPDHLGVFLPTSWRMHPDVCRVVSGAVYEGRLEADPPNAARVVRLPKRGAKRVTVEAGVVFVPCEHEGNAQSSPEEVALVSEIIDELLGRLLTPKVGDTTPARRVTCADILVVTPYNMQVRALRAALPEGVTVGTVDKFQGQEAPIAIVSMCASSGELAPRGVDFLLNPNRLNVALSRAQSLAVVVGEPGLARVRVGSVREMGVVDFFCRVVG